MVLPRPTRKSTPQTKNSISYQKCKILRVIKFLCLEHSPVGPTASLSGLNAVEVSTEDVNEDNADEINGELLCPGGRKPKDENNDGGGGMPPGPGLVVADNGCCCVRGVRSSAPRELESDGVGLPGCCDEGGRGTWTVGGIGDEHLCSLQLPGVVTPDRAGDFSPF